MRIKTVTHIIHYIWYLQIQQIYNNSSFLYIVNIHKMTTTTLGVI